MKKILKEFKTFAIKGNVMDLAIGVIIGGAFSKIISSLVNDIAMPFIGMFLGGINFQTWIIELPRIFGQTDPIQFKIGVFINTVIEFLIISVVVFIFMKAINKLKRKQEEAPQTATDPTNEEVLLTEIRDILKDLKDK